MRRTKISLSKETLYTRLLIKQVDTRKRLNAKKRHTNINKKECKDTSFCTKFRAPTNCGEIIFTHTLRRRSFPLWSNLQVQQCGLQLLSRFHFDNYSYSTLESKRKVRGFSIDWSSLASRRRLEDGGSFLGVFSDVSSAQGVEISTEVNVEQ